MKDKIRKKKMKIKESKQFKAQKIQRKKMRKREKEKKRRQKYEKAKNNYRNLSGEAKDDLTRKGIYFGPAGIDHINSRGMLPKRKVFKKSKKEREELGWVRAQLAARGNH